MINQADIGRIIGRDVYGPDNAKIGSAARVYQDTRTGEPEFVTVRTGLFGTKESFVPLSKADLLDDQLRVPFEKDQVKNAPRIDSGRELSQEEEDQIYDYYGADRTSGRGFEDAAALHAQDQEGMFDDTGGAPLGETGGAPLGDTGGAPLGHDTSGPTTDDAMTRSEEHLVAGVRREPIGKARLRKYVVTEEQQVTVPVSHEEVRVVREPITDANVDRAMAGPEISEEEHEMTLEAERPVVETQAVPVERVRLGKEKVTGTETVSGQVRKEQIEVDEDAPGIDDNGRPL